jgi:hypothetical protein
LSSVTSYFLFNPDSFQPLRISMPYQYSEKVVYNIFYIYNKKS